MNVPVQRRDATFQAPVKLGNEVELIGLLDEKSVDAEREISSDLRKLYEEDVAEQVKISPVLLMLSAFAVIALSSVGYVSSTKTRTFSAAKSPLSAISAPQVSPEKAAAQIDVEGDLVKLQWRIEKWAKDHELASVAFKRVSHKGLQIDFDEGDFDSRGKKALGELSQIVADSKLPMHLLIEHAAPLAKNKEAAKFLASLHGQLEQSSFLTRQGRQVTWFDQSSKTKASRVTFKLVVDKKFRGD